jgi:hypothetical protein
VPIIPLYDSPPSPDAWHRVRAPGGYEWWHFDAEDAQHDRRLVVTFYDGYVFDPTYQRCYAAFRRQPTRHSPPLPSEFPCVEVALYENGQARFSKKLTAGKFVGSDDSPALAIGDNRVEKLGYSLRISLRDDSLSVQMTFTPKFSHAPIELLLDGHHWIVADPLCDVDAKIQFFGEAIEFRGRGFRDHHFGTAPPPRSRQGRVLLDDAMCVFRISPSPILIEADESGMWQTQLIQLDQAISLSNPRALDSSRMIYDAIWRGRAAKALCTIIHGD